MRKAQYNLVSSRGDGYNEDFQDVTLEQKNADDDQLELPTSHGPLHKATVDVSSPGDVTGHSCWTRVFQDETDEQLEATMVDEEAVEEYKNQRANCAGVVGGSLGMAMGGFWLSLVCASGCMYAAKDEEGRAGQAARACGRIALRRFQASTAVVSQVMRRGGGAEQEELCASIRVSSALERPRPPKNKELGEVDSAGTVWIDVKQEPPAEDQVVFSFENLENTPALGSMNPMMSANLVPFPVEKMWCMPCHSSDSNFERDPKRGNGQIKGLSTSHQVEESTVGSSTCSESTSSSEGGNSSLHSVHSSAKLLTPTRSNLVVPLVAENMWCIPCST